MNEFIINDALTFMTVIDEGSFRAAGKKWGISSSVISKRISRLENQLRVQLIQRTTRTLSLTDTGRLFYERCQRIKAEIHDAAQDVLQHHEEPSGLLRINAPMSFGQLHLVPAINDFIRVHPDLQIELVLGSQYSSFIHEGLDLAIIIKDLPNSNLLKSRKITVRSTGIYGSPEYFKQRGLPITPHDLAEHNCLIYQSEPGSQLWLGQKHEWVFYHQEREKFSVPVSGNLRVNSSQALVQAAKAGVGLVKLSSFMVTEGVKTGELISVLDDYCAKDIDIHAVYPNQRYLPSKVTAFIDFLIQRFHAEGYWDRN